MKKILLIISCLTGLLFSNAMIAQTFTTTADTINITVASHGAFHNDITNLTTKRINIRWSMISNDFPSDWLAALGVCDAQSCYPDLGPHTTDDSSYFPNQPGLFDIQFVSFINAVPGTHYITFALRDMTSIGGSSKNITFIVNKFPTSVTNTAKSSDEVTLYPNPARKELNVLFNAEADVRMISVYNMIGKSVSVYKLSSNSSAMLDIENLPQGIYFIRLIDGQGQVVATRKFTHQ